MLPVFSIYILAWLIVDLHKISGLTIQANLYYKILINWTSQKVKEAHARHNAFDFKNGKASRLSCWYKINMLNIFMYLLVGDYLKLFT